MPISRPENSPILIIMITGFTMLIALILSLGFTSVHRVEIVRNSAEDLEQEYLRHLNTALKLRDLVSKIYIEAQETVVARRHDPKIKAYTALPPTTSAALTEQLEILKNTPISQTAEWQRFTQELSKFITIVTVPLDFQLYGFTQQTQVFNTLDEVILVIRTKRPKIIFDSQQLEIKAQHDIMVTTFISLSVGLLVAGISIIEVQRRWRQLRRSYQVIDDAKEFNINIINGVISPLFTLNTNGQVTSVNQAFCQLFSVDSAILGTHYLQVLKDQPELRNLISKYLVEEVFSGSYRGRINLKTWDKTLRFDLFMRSFKRDSRPQGLILFLVDMTEVEQAQEERKRNQALAAIGQIATQVAHEIKNPLGSIKLNIAYLNKLLPHEEEAQEVLSEIDLGIDRLNRTVLELSTFVRPKRLSLDSTDINQIIKQQLSLVADRIAHKQIVVDFQSQTEIPLGMFDAHELGKAFINFIINAIDASEPASKITITTSWQDNKVMIGFIDSGAGMDIDTLTHLFEPFFTTKPTGTGLGMSIAKKVIEMHAGEMKIDSSVGQGTKITVMLPLKEVVI